MKISTKEEQYRKILEQEVFIDGVTKNVFIQSEFNESGFSRYDCTICNVTGLQGDAITSHNSGKKHQKFFTRNFKEKGSNTSQSHLMTLAYNSDKPLIGKGYIIEIQSQPTHFLCALCCKTCDGSAVISHLSSHRHRMAYLCKHFKYFMGVLNGNNEFNMNMTCRENVLTEISREILRKSDAVPTVVKEIDFKYNKNALIEGVINLPHFSENDWPEYRDVFERILKFFIYENSDEDTSSDDENVEHCYQRAPIKRESSEAKNSRICPSISRNSQRDSPPRKKPHSEKDHSIIDQNSPVTLISTCRLLLALDSEVGPLLSKQVLDLFSEAIKTEKLKANSSNALLDKNENLVLIEIIKQKFIGILNAEFASAIKTNAIKNALTSIEKLVDEHNKRQEEQKYRESQKQQEKPENPQPKIDFKKSIERVKKIAEERKKNEGQQAEEERNNVDLNLLNDEDIEVLLERFSELNEVEQLQIKTFMKNLNSQNPSRAKKFKSQF